MGKQQVSTGLVVLAGTAFSIVTVKVIKQAITSKNKSTSKQQKPIEQIKTQDKVQESQQQVKGQNNISNILPQIAEEYEIQSQPLDRILHSKVLPYTPKQIFQELYENDSTLYPLWFKTLDFHDFSDSKWHIGESQKLERVVKYKCPLENIPVPGCPKFGDNTEHIVLTAQNDHIIIIDMKVRTPNVPFGKTFYTQNRIVVLLQSPNSCTFTVSQKIVYTGFNLLKGIINSKNRDETTNGYKVLFELLDEKMPSQASTVNQSSFAKDRKQEIKQDIQPKAQQHLQPDRKTLSMSKKETAAVAVTFTLYYAIVYYIYLNLKNVS